MEQLEIFWYPQQQALEKQLEKTVPDHDHPGGPAVRPVPARLRGGSGPGRDDPIQK